MGQFLGFCKDFGFLGKNSKERNNLINIWKSASETNSIITYDQFKKTLEKIPHIKRAIEENPEKNEYLIFEMLSIDAEKTYKKKLKGFNLAFGIKDPEAFRELPEEFRSKKKYKPLSTNEVRKILEESQIRKTKMESQLRVQAKEKSKLDQSRHTDTLKYSSLDESAFLMGRNSSYISLKGKATIPKYEQKNKLTWQKLQELTSTDMKALIDDGFKPSDLIDEFEDEEDQIYLADYRVVEEKQEKVKEENNRSKAIEEYGTIKSTVRPTQKYLYMQSEINKMGVYNDDYQVEYNNQSNVKGGNQTNMKKKLMDRVKELEVADKKKEQQLLKNLESKKPAYRTKKNKMNL